MYRTRYLNEYLDYVMRPGRDWRIVIPGIDSDYLTNFTFESVLGDRSLFTIGTVATSRITLELFYTQNGESSFKNTSISPSLQLRTMVMIDDVLTEIWQTVPLGTYTISSVNRVNNSTISLEAYDKMSDDKYGNKEYVYSGTFPASCIDVVNDIAAKFGCGVSVNNIPDIQLTHEEKINGKTARNVLGYIAALGGGFCKINRTGRIEFFKLYDTNITYKPENGMRELIEKEETFTIGGFKCQTEPGNHFITAGNPNDEESTIELINYDMTKENLNSIYNEYRQLKFWSLILDGMLNPAIDCGDILTIENQKGIKKKILVQSYNYAIKGGPQGKYECEYDLEDMEWDEVSDEEEEDNTLEQEILDELDEIYTRLDELENADYPDFSDIYDRLEALEARDCVLDLSDIYARLEDLDRRITKLENSVKEISGENRLTGLYDRSILVNESVKYIMSISGDYSIIKNNNNIEVTVSGETITVKGVYVGTTDLKISLEVDGEVKVCECIITVTRGVDYVNINLQNKCILVDCGTYAYGKVPATNSSISYKESPLTYRAGLLSNKMSSPGDNHYWWAIQPSQYYYDIGAPCLAGTGRYSLKGLFAPLFTNLSNYGKNKKNMYLEISVELDYSVNNASYYKFYSVDLEIYLVLSYGEGVHTNIINRTSGGNRFLSVRDVSIEENITGSRKKYVYDVIVKAIAEPENFIPTISLFIGPSGGVYKDYNGNFNYSSWASIYAEVNSVINKLEVKYRDLTSNYQG